MMTTDHRPSSHLAPGAGWELDAACNPLNAPDVDPRLFDTPTTRGRLALARDEYCNVCPVRHTCLEAGQSRKETGIWGGVVLDGGKLVPDVDVPFRRKGEDW